MSDLKVGDRVKFTGPAYEPDGNGPKIGQVGEVIRRDGYKSQKVGEQAVELITVVFDGDPRPSNIGINRLNTEDFVIPNASYPFQQGTLDSLYAAKRALNRAIQSYEMFQIEGKGSKDEGNLFATLDNIDTALEEIKTAKDIAVCQTIE